MYLRTIPTGTDVVPDSVRFVASRNSVYAATADGRLLAIRLFDGTVAELGTGFLTPVGVVQLADGIRLAIGESEGTVLVVSRDTADRDHARVLAQLPSYVLALDEHPDADALLILSDSQPDGTLPALLRCDLESGDIEVIAADLEGARTLNVDADGRTALVFSAVAGSGRTLTTVNLDDGTVDRVTTEDYDHIAYAPTAGALGVFATRFDPAADTDVLTFWDGAESVTEPLPGPVPVAGLTRWGSLVLVAAGSNLHALEWDLEEGELPITVPLAPLVATGYARLLVDLPTLGLTPGDVTYSVREGFDAGSISLGVEPPNPDGSESVMLLAGYLRGEFHVEATNTADGSLLAVRRFRVTTLWPDDVAGPPVAVTGDVGATLMDWGGTGGIAGYRVLPPPREWRVLTVLLFLNDRKYDDEEATRNQWKDLAIGGGASLRHYYEEVSAFVPDPNGRGVTVKLVGDKVFGPIKVEMGWGDAFKQRGGADAGWLSTPKGKKEMAGAVSTFFADMPGGVNTIALADSFVFVIRSGSDGPVPMGAGNPDLPTKYVWGHADPTKLWRKTEAPPGQPTTFTQFERPVSFMSDVYPAAAPIGDVSRTLCHEFGHNLGLKDLYNRGDFTAEVEAREVGGMDLMHSSEYLPHFSLANRTALGWIDPAWLRRFDFTANPTGDTVRLQSIETVEAGGPTDGRVAGIEIPISDDWSYLFEYRRTQPGQLGDQLLKPSVIADDDKAIIGTDVRWRGGETARPPILRLPEDVDGDGPVLHLADTNYRDSDTTNPARMHDFVLTLNRLAPPFEDDTAEVTVEYLEAHRPQLLVHPAPGNGNLKSEDIKLVSAAGAAVPNVVKGATNFIDVTVHNVGSLEATKAEITVKWLPFTLTGSEEWRELVPPEPFLVPKKDKKTVRVAWPLESSVPVGDTRVEATHFCVRVEIKKYFDEAHPESEEIVVFDNWAQSNFDTAPVGHGSPSDRHATAATATNTLERRATYQFDVTQSTPWYRVYLGNAWLELDPGQTRTIDLAYESLAGDPLHGKEFDRHIEEINGRDHHVAVTSSVLPESTECDTPRTVFGCGLTLRSGLRVLIDEISYTVEGVSARIRSQQNGQWHKVSSGTLHCAVWPDDDPEHAELTNARIRNGFVTVGFHQQTAQDLHDGRPLSFVLARPGDNIYVATVTSPAPMQL